MLTRQYVVNGERRSFTLLRPTGDTQAQDTLRETLLAVFADHVSNPVAGNPPSLATAPLNEATCRAGPRGRRGERRGCRPGAGRPAVWEIACVARGGVVSYSYKDEYAKTPVVGAPARAGSRHDAPRQPVGHHPHLWAACLPLPPRPAARTPYLLDVPHPGGPLQRALCAGRGARALSAGGRGLGSGLGGGDPARAAQPRADRACPAGARTPGA